MATGRVASASMVATTVLMTLALGACGSSRPNYTPLTAANISTHMMAAVQDKHTAHEVATSGDNTATIDFDTAGTFRYRIESTSGTTTQALIGIGQDIYLQTKAASTWLKTDATAAGSKISATTINPVTTVTGFNEGIQKLTYVGATVIDGAQVQHYRITIDQAKYLKSLGQGAGSTNLGANETIAEDLYLNNDNSLRRVSIVMPAGVGNVQIDVTKWGAPVAISAPPAANVTPAPTATPAH